ncbi:hypothetical protein ABZ820_34730 [Streptomyces diacarni]|uniref:hypothetical protein n=1 Tax=Streptomyces diacarni TaxID=2800381 RepID=UPI0033DB32CA
MPRYAYLIKRTDPGTDPDRRVLSRGTRISKHTPDQVAARLLARNRAEHSYYTGPRRCWIWEHHGDSLVLDPAPSDAQPYDG